MGDPLDTPDPSFDAELFSDPFGGGFVEKVTLDDEMDGLDMFDRWLILF